MTRGSQTDDRFVAQGGFLVGGELNGQVTFPPPAWVSGMLADSRSHAMRAAKTNAAHVMIFSPVLNARLWPTPSLVFKMSWVRLEPRRSHIMNKQLLVSTCDRSCS